MSKSLSRSTGGAKNITQAFAGTAGLTLAAGGAVLYLLNGQINSSQAMANNLAAQVGSSEQIAKRYQVTQDAYDHTKARIAILDSSVTEKSYVPTLLQQLQTLAVTTHLKVSSVHPTAISAPAPPAKADNGPGADKKKAAPPPPYDMMKVDLNVAGTYADTAAFVYGLTHFPKVLAVEGVQMTPGGADIKDKTAGPQVTSVVKLTAFVFHDDAPAAAPAGPGPSNQGGSKPPAPPVRTVGAVVPPTPDAAARRAAQGAITATRNANSRSVGTL